MQPIERKESTYVHQYTDIQKLDAEIIRAFISRINVYAAEKVKGKRRQHIQIVYNCISEFQPPKHKKNDIADMIINYAEIFRDYEVPSQRHFSLAPFKSI